MSDQDGTKAERLAGLIARVRRELKRPDLNPEVRTRLEKELAIYMETWERIDPLKGRPRSDD